MTEFFLRTLLSLIGTSLCLVAALLFLPRMRIRAGMRRVIWVLFALRLLLPFALPMPGAPAITLPERESVHTTVSRPTETVTAPRPTAPTPETKPAAPQQSAAPAPTTPQTAPKTAPAISLKACLLTLWAAGALLFAGWHIAGHFLVRRRLL
ncbi:MAG: hypothetical protein E7458_07715, partial [Ruminococcaceae bacterium]|nr:hypothetical protein [Oscillospiraceae bacterium]